MGMCGGFYLRNSIFEHQKFSFYKFTNKTNGMVYIGMTMYPLTRHREHAYQWRRGRGPFKSVENWDDLEYKILFTVTTDYCDALRLEDELIHHVPRDKRYNSNKSSLDV